jgi:hypothetical protein
MPSLKDVIPSLSLLHIIFFPFKSFFFICPSAIVSGLYPKLAVASCHIYSLSGTRGRQFAYCYVHLAPSLRTPAPHLTHLNSVTFRITFPISVSQFCSCVHVCMLLVFLVLVYFNVFIQYTPWTCFPTPSVHVIQLQVQLCVYQNLFEGNFNSPPLLLHISNMAVDS